MGTSQSSPLLSSSESTQPLEQSINDFGASITEHKHHENEDQPIASNRLNLNFSSYEPPKSPVHPIAHYIFLVHGWLGNGLEMDYLSSAVQGITFPVLDPKDDNNLNSSSSSPSSPTPDNDSKRIRKSNSYESRLLENQYNNNNNNNNNNRSSDDATEHDDTMAVVVPDIIIHSVKCNVGRTHDGIRMGGTRLANEIIQFIRSDIQKRQKQSRIMDSDDNAVHVTYSIVGNSLGGLYARYALSLIPYQIPLVLQQQQQQTLKQPMETRPMLHLHPNVFCTTATPHLGVSRHTYLPIPRIAEKLIGTGMGTTGRDLFRLNSEKELTTGASREESVRFPSKNDAKMNDSGDNDAVVANQSTNWEDDDEEMECIIRNMCLQEKYLSPLRNFRRRIAYANVYGTDFQVPTVTAAFLHEQSEVGHFLVASRELPKVESSNDSGQEHGVLPSFIVAVVCTEKQSQRQSPSNSDGVDATTKSTDELLEMSRSLDALGWTKVFVDVRDRIPIPGLARPSWFRPRYDSLDDLIRKRIGFTHPLTNDGEIMAASSKRRAGDDTSTSPLKSVGTNSDTCSGHCILTSQDLSQSTQVSDSIHFPMGHTVMIANTKNEQYSQWNRLGRPVMDRLAEDIVKYILEFE